MKVACKNFSASVDDQGLRMCISNEDGDDVRMTFLFQTGFCGSRGDVYLTTLTSMKNPSPEGGHFATESERLWRCEDANVQCAAKIGFFFVF